MEEMRYYEIRGGTRPEAKRAPRMEASEKNGGKVSLRVR